ncbi:hypothetical protein D0869_04781 [Hortaea werneckii]|uniref:DUF1783-domain-containing protein n=1 Tax=Hortaea werneckii TaxID=91943 RepID=A0A3M6YZ37_HORWE|nr:hypothetical protein KC330_g5337 [Hortaea werneckii]RMX84155.1 hypothetical protein D0869_04781 [Hortaea werneckii]RMY08298.1 hypothetical protein D0868_04877 [Hortaea werneckii]RMY28860.1 hypothetical protein D0865_15658 [Hortaea werneckii]
MMPQPRIRPLRLQQLFRKHAVPRRTLVEAPRPGSGPLMERRGDRALPTISTGIPRWLKTLPLFAVVMTASMLGIFNYQKQSSSVVSSTLYALRTNAEAREILGDEIYFASQIPWIHGEINQLHGRIDISFWVKGTKRQGLMRFKSDRPTRMGYFQTHEWSLEPEGGQKVSLLQGNDPFQQETADKVGVAA